VSAPIRIVGSYLSPFVRKVLACLDLKGLAYEIDPIPPFFGDDRFTQLSPLRRVPVLIDDRVTPADSSVIVQYLEDRYPQPALFPAGVADLSLAVSFRNFGFARQRIDVERWPLTAAYVDRVLALPCLTKLHSYEELLMRTPVAKQRAALAAIDAPLTADTIGGEATRPGSMRS
jgi:glutathione S-transferase